MGKSSAQKYRDNPASYAKKKRYDAKFNQKPEQRAKRTQLSTERRRARRMGLALTGKDLSHTKNGGIVLEDSRLNRARNGHGNNGRLK